MLRQGLARPKERSRTTTGLCPLPVPQDPDRSGSRRGHSGLLAARGPARDRSAREWSTWTPEPVGQVSTNVLSLETRASPRHASRPVQNERHRGFTRAFLRMNRLARRRALAGLGILAVLGAGVSSY